MFVLKGKALDILKGLYKQSLKKSICINLINLDIKTASMQSKNTSLKNLLTLEVTLILLL